jgi:aminoglycoside phosphotransferase (APT) family kinase protein
VSVDPRPNREWTAEHIVGPEQARELLRAQFPFFGSADITPVAEGWDNTVYLVGGRWVFRFPRRTVAVPTVEKEIDVLPPLAPRLPLPVPVPELVGTPTESYPWPFWGARLIDGRELPDHQLPSESRIDLASDVGAFLAVLHAPDQKAAVGAHLPLDPMHRGTPRVRVPMASKRLARLQQSGFWQGDPAVERLLAQAEGLGASAAEPVLAHGDLHVRHVLVGEDARATGVIDWGDVCLADRAIDVALAYAAFSGRARAAFFAAYGSVTGDCEMRARVLAVYLSATLAEYAADAGNELLLRETLQGLTWAAGDEPKSGP